MVTRVIAAGDSERENTCDHVIALLYWEQAAVLYVLSTLALSALLVVVMFSNPEARDKEHHQAALEKIDAEATAAAKKRVA